MNVKEKLIRIRETVVSPNPPENTSGILWIKYNDGADNPFSFYLHDGIEWNPVAITATGGAELSQSQIEAIRKASRLVIDGDGLNYLSDDGTYKPIPNISVDIPTRLSQLVNDCGFITEDSIPTKTSQLVNDSNFLTEHQKIKTINGDSLIGEGNITIKSGGSSVTVDSTLSDSSTNPVQNKVIKEAIDSKQDKGDYALKSEIPDISGLAKKTEIPDISGKADKTEIPDVSDLATKEEVARVEDKVAANAADILKKVDKVDGKGLSTNDYTDADKTKVGKALTEHQSLDDYYTKEEVDNKVAQGGTFDPTAYYNKHDVDSLVGGKVDKVEGKALSSNDYTDDDKAKVASAITEHQDISGKQDVISDLEAIREGAAKGETALQSFTESDPLYTKDKPNIALKSEIPDVSGLANKSDIPDISGLVKPSDLAEVATSGDYNDLTNKPSIPSEVTEQTVSGWGFTKNSGDYSKPSGGIPKADLASSVQTSLGKADTALQSVPSDYRTAAAQDAIDSGKVDKVTGKGLSTNDYTDAEKTKVADALTQHQDISGKQDVIKDLDAIRSGASKGATALQSYTETDPTVPSWAKQATKPSYTASEVGALPSTTKIPSKTSDLTNDSGFLTQHQSIKTVNGNSLVGEGDLTIEGGGGSYDASSIYHTILNSTSDRVEIDSDEFDALLAAVKSGKTIYATWSDESYVEVEYFVAYAYEYDGEIELRLNLLDTGEWYTILISKDSDGSVDSSRLLKQDIGEMKSYDIWNTYIGVAILGLEDTSLVDSSDITDESWLNLCYAINGNYIIRGVTYAKYIGNTVYLAGFYPSSNVMRKFYVTINYTGSGYQIRNNLSSIYCGEYRLVKVDAASAVSIKIDPRNDRICYYIDDMSAVSSLSVQYLGFESGGSVLYDQPREWMIQFAIPTGISTLPSVTWPSTMRWADGKVLSLEAGYTYEFHIVATRLCCTVVGQKFIEVI